MSGEDSKRPKYNEDNELQLKEASCSSTSHKKVNPSKREAILAAFSSKIDVICIPLGGNCFFRKGLSSCESGNVCEEGIRWDDTNTKCCIYFKLNQPETFNATLRIMVESGISSIKVSIGDQSYYLEYIENREWGFLPVGKFFANDQGYVKMEIEGVSKTGPFYAIISDLILEKIKGQVQFVKMPQNFYFGRRGPSVHLRYEPPPEIGDKPLDYFYSEVMVPYGQDHIGTYFMANGFSEGYFGIQVNSQTERRVLFSVWSDYETDDPEQIPEEYRVRLIKKGTNVKVQTFGDEGAGLQSYLVAQWKSETTYRFLLFGKPNGSGGTTFTAWWSSEHDPEWYLISSMSKPMKSTHLKSLYSFSENFHENNGHLERRALFGNQWIRTASECQWYEITKAVFTGDETSKKDRDDFDGGTNGNQFYLRNCGFFHCKWAKRNQKFGRASTGGGPPAIELSQLP